MPESAPIVGVQAWSGGATGAAATLGAPLWL
jgi:hypothetical protein